jgi:hypothetical protein
MLDLLKKDEVMFGAIITAIFSALGLFSYFIDYGSNLDNLFVILTPFFILAGLMVINLLLTKKGGF